MSHEGDAARDARTLGWCDGDGTAGSSLIEALF
jgi:hypothetical protein